ncbi:MAG TPA: SDR family NAD(P)-dependent oxidoreductase [Microbacteriaceae bacterium]|nr:SDR family NAD(P)-dependent oxidoreductase [Microbacteriaceae bacterium]
MSETPARVALITGCGKPDGMGAAIARALAARGDTVVVTDRLPAGVENVGDAPESGPGGLGALVEELSATGTQSLALLGDIGDAADVERMYAQVDDAFGRLDVLVNNAAAPQGADRADVADVPVEAWQEQLRVTLHGTFLMSRAAIQRMRPARYGRIVNVSSMAGIDAAGRSTAYSAAKAGILGLTRSLAIDVAGWGITVNAVCPGLVATSRSMLGRRGGDRDAAMRQMATRIPVGRVGVPEDVAHAVDFLSHERSGYITAQSLPIDGGGIDRLSMGRPPEA